MVSRVSRFAGGNVPPASRRQHRRWGAGICSVLGAVALLSTGLTTGAVAADVQSKQWYLSAMKAEEMWKVSNGEGVKVAVIDTGVNPDTPSLRGRVLADESSVSLAHKATEDDNDHGSTMAELIAGTGAGGGLKGLAPGAKFVPYLIAIEYASKSERQRPPDLSYEIRAAA